MAGLIHAGHGLSPVRQTEDWAVDWMNRLQVDTRWLNPPGSVGLTWLDMDEASFAAWGEPFHVPRDRLARLIRYAAEGGAAAIVVDVDLSQRFLQLDDLGWISRPPRDRCLQAMDIK